MLLFWLVIVIAVILCQSAIFYKAYMTMLYNKHWLDELFNISGAYECTYPQLWINVVYL